MHKTTIWNPPDSILALTWASITAHLPCPHCGHRRSDTTDPLEALEALIGDLFQDGQTLALDIHEIKAELTGIRNKVQEGFSAIIARLDQINNNNS